MKEYLVLFPRVITILCGIVALGLMADIYKDEHVFKDRNYRIGKFNLSSLTISIIITIPLFVLAVLGKCKSGPIYTIDVAGHLLCGTLTAMSRTSFMFLFMEVNEYYREYPDVQEHFKGMTPPKMAGYKTFRVKAIIVLALEFLTMIMYPIIVLLAAKAPAQISSNDLKNLPK